MRQTRMERAQARRRCRRIRRGSYGRDAKDLQCGESKRVRWSGLISRRAKCSTCPFYGGLCKVAGSYKRSALALSYGCEDGVPLTVGRRKAGRTCHIGAPGWKDSGCDRCPMLRILPDVGNLRFAERRAWRRACRFLPEQLSGAMTKAGATGGSMRRDTRAQRLAAALKANLRRRKVQARQRAAETGGAEQDAASATAHDSARVVADKRSA
jgi:hypothetical protein